MVSRSPSGGGKESKERREEDRFGGLVRSCHVGRQHHRYRNESRTTCLLSRRLPPLRDSRYDRARAQRSYRFIAHGISSGARVSAAPYYGLLSGSKPHIHDPGTGHEREANLRYHLPSSPSPSLPPPLFSVASWPVSYFEKGRKERKKEPSFRIDFLPSGWRDGLDRFHERNKIFRLSTGLLPGPLS